MSTDSRLRAEVRWREAHKRQWQSIPADVSEAPPGPRAPRHLLGAYWLLAERDLLKRCRRRYGDVFSLRTWPIGFLVVIADPTEIKRVFKGDHDQLRAGEANGIMLPITGAESVLLLDGKRHLNRRKLMLPSFHGKRIDAYEQLTGEVADAEIERWPVGEPFPLYASMQRITLRVILRAVLGIEDAVRGAELERLLPKLLNSPAMLWPVLQRDMGARSPWRRFVALRERVDAVLFDELARKRSDPDLAEHEDILSMLLCARDENGEAMSDDELRDQLVTLLLAGHTTTAAALAWTFERVLRTPVVHACLRTAVAEGDDRYLECCIKEVLRLRPVVPVAVRHVTAPFPVGGYTVPAGSLLVCSMILTHTRPDLYPEPAAFRPERFMEDAPDTYTWLPFGGGVRRCIGAAFATFEMKVILRRVFARCKLYVPDARSERQCGHITYIPSRGARVVLRSRDGVARSRATG